LHFGFLHGEDIRAEILEMPHKAFAEARAQAVYIP